MEGICKYNYVSATARQAAVDKVLAPATAFHKPLCSSVIYFITSADCSVCKNITQRSVINVLRWLQLPVTRMDIATCTHNVICSYVKEGLFNFKHDFEHIFRDFTGIDSLRHFWLCFTKKIHTFLLQF